MNTFRGKTVSQNEWVFGDRVQGASGKMYIFDYDDILGHSKIDEVIPETVGQFIEQLDSKGNRIYVGDKFQDQGECECESGYLLVEWNKEESRFELNVYDYPISYGEGSQEVFGSEIECVDENVIDMSALSEFEIIGNIHESEVSNG